MRLKIKPFGLGILQAISAIIVYTTLLHAQTPAAGNSDKETKTYPPGSAWTLSWPLGNHIESTLDTVLYNYQREFTSAIQSDAWATTGQFTGPAINMIYFERPESRSFYFNNSIGYWLPSFQKQKFYNMYIPFTQVSYGWGYGTENRTDHLKITFAGNVNKKIGLGAWIEYPYTKGSYAEQATKGLGYGFSGYYNGDHYEMQAFFNHTNHLNKENGGITNDLYITDPAELQGGYNTIEPKSIPVHLTSAHNRLVGMEFYMNHAYKLGFWRDVTQPEDTVEREEFVPVTKFVYSLDWKKDRRLFINTNSTEAREFWTDTYFNASSTRESDNYWSVSNCVGIELIEGFQKWAKFGLGAYINYEIDKYRYGIDGMYERPADTAEAEASGLSELPKDYTRSLGETRHRMWIGGRLEKTRGSILRYSADARFGLVGDAAGEIDLTGQIQTRFRLAKDTVSITAEGAFSNLSPNYMLNHYVGNHFIWNNDFNKIQKYRVGGKLYIPWTRTELSVNFENIGNYIYFNELCRPQQHGGQIQVFSASIDQKLKFGIWNWDNRLTYQASSDNNVLPLPSFSLYSNMYLYFHAFRALTVQVGVDCNWYTKYTALSYQPATMTFHTQGTDPVKVGNFIFSDVYLTCKLYKVRFFLMCSHLNQGWFSKDYFSLPHYPVDPRQFRLGLSIDFAN
ncbi:MAG: putative porin [Bacteroides sp.]|nr:putative porin [Bacteroidales bacterium]MBD5205931.1 putative porin [Bacteroidales bacterium]MBD5305363.1 putative porin [Bacteroides sp.]